MKLTLVAALCSVFTIANADVRPWKDEEGVEGGQASRLEGLRRQASHDPFFERELGEGSEEPESISNDPAAALKINSTILVTGESETGASCRSRRGVDSLNIARGGSVTFCIEVMNTGDTPLLDVTLTEGLLLDRKAEFFDVLSPGEAEFITVTEIAEKDMFKTFTVTGIPATNDLTPIAGADVVTDSDNVSVTVTTESERMADLPAETSAGSCEERFVIGFDSDVHGKPLSQGDTIDSSVLLPGGVSMEAQRRGENHHLNGMVLGAQVVTKTKSDSFGLVPEQEEEQGNVFVISDADNHNSEGEGGEILVFFRQLVTVNSIKFLFDKVQQGLVYGGTIFLYNESNEVSQVLFIPSGESTKIHVMQIQQPGILSMSIRLSGACAMDDLDLTVPCLKNDP